MKISLFLAAIAGATVYSGAANAQQVFTEFSVGAGFPSHVKTVDYDIISDVAVTTPSGVIIAPGDQVTGAFSGSYKAGITGGLEIGRRGVGDKHVSLTVSYDYLQANLRKVTASGTVNGTPIQGSVSSATLEDLGFVFNKKAHLLLGNIRYDFVGPRQKVQPFVEFGGGGTFIQDSKAQAAFGATAGVKLALPYGFYVGARYRFAKTFSYTDQLGLDYKTLDAHLLSVMFGGQM